MARDNEDGERNWESPESAPIYEYSSIIHAFYDSVLRPVVQSRQRMDRDALEMIASELEFKVQDKKFKKLPFKIQNAYQSLFNLVNTLKETSDAVIEEYSDVLHGNFLLGICCNSFGEDM